MMAPAAPRSCLARLAMPEPRSARTAAAEAWHRQGMPAFPAEVLDAMPKAHRSFIEHIAAAQYGARLGGKSA